MGKLDLLEVFLANKSHNTGRSYRTALKSFKAWYGRGDVWKLKAVDAARFLAHLKAQGASGNTVQHRFNALKSIFQFHVDMGAIASNPFKLARFALSSRKPAQVRPTRLLDFGEVHGRIDSMPSNTPQERRDRAILAVLFGCGLRRSELTKLTTDSIKKNSKGVLYFQLRDTKGGGDQEQPIPAWIIPIVFAILSDLKMLATASYCQPLFMHYRPGKRCGQPVAPEYVYRLFKRHFGVGPHSARATGASKLLGEGHSIKAVQAFLRHNKPDQVLIYDRRVIGLENNPGRFLQFH